MARSPPAPTPTPRSPAASILTPRSPPPPTSTPRLWAQVATAVDLGVQKELHDDGSGGFDDCKEEHDIGEVQAEHWRAVKVEKDTYPGHDEHRGIRKVEKDQQTSSMGEEPRKSKKTRRKRQSDSEAIGMGHKPPKSKKRKENKQSSGELQEGYQGTKKVIMEYPGSKEKTKGGVSTKPSVGPLPIEKDKQPRLSNVVRSPVLHNVVASFLERRAKKAKSPQFTPCWTLPWSPSESLDMSPSHPSLLALSPKVANLGSRRP